MQIFSCRPSKISHRMVLCVWPSSVVGMGQKNSKLCHSFSPSPPTFIARVRLEVSVRVCECVCDAGRRTVWVSTTGKCVCVSNDECAWENSRYVDVCSIGHWTIYQDDLLFPCLIRLSKTLQLVCCTWLKPILSAFLLPSVPLIPFFSHTNRKKKFSQHRARLSLSKFWVRVLMWRLKAW